MLDLKAKLAAAGVVTKEQVEKFDKDQAVARDKRRADEAKAAERKAAKAKPRHTNSNNKKPTHKRGPKPRRVQDSNPSGIDVEALKKLNRGDAYARIRKIVDHSRLDDKERTIPKPDDQIFNFVTSKGKVSRLYLTAETVKSLQEGKSGISSFMSHHGLSHCVLPKEVAVALAEVFPFWLRHLQGHAAAGEIEVPEPPPEVPSQPTPEVPSQPVPEVPSEPVPEVPSEPVPEVPSQPVPEVPSEPVPEIAPGPPQDEPTEPFEIPTIKPRTPQ